VGGVCVGIALLSLGMRSPFEIWSALDQRSVDASGVVGFAVFLVEKIHGLVEVGARHFVGELLSQPPVGAVAFRPVFLAVLLAENLIHEFSLGLALALEDGVNCLFVGAGSP